jgi:Pyridine nucleotide-disulphide oxidoreductase/Pyridine nucleotide-disulphide oxidoreductase, dimerisation domain
VPDMAGLDQVNHLTNTSMVDLDVLPRHLVIVGGGYVALEFAQMYRRFGSEVTVVEKAPHLIQREDEDVSVAVKDILEAEGIRIRLRAECISFAQHGADIAVGVDCESGDQEVVGSHVLLAVGRRPNTDDLGLDRAGIETDTLGYIMVDDQLRTSVPGVWALGDCNGKGAFAEAWHFGKRILVGTRPMTRVARAIEKGEMQGFIKIVVDADTREILGAASASAATRSSTAFSTSCTLRHPTRRCSVPCTYIRPFRSSFPPSWLSSSPGLELTRRAKSTPTSPILGLETTPVPAWFARTYETARGTPASPSGHSSAARCQFPKSAAASYVHCRNSKSVSSGISAALTTS